MGAYVLHISVADKDRSALIALCAEIPAMQFNTICTFKENVPRP